MARFFHLLYYYLLALLVLFVAYLTAMLMLSPKQDLQKRGFIPCTEQFVLNVSDCTRGEMICPLKYLWQDTACNTKVIFEGFGAWVKGKQPTPWSNYLFEPELSAEADMAAYNGDIVTDMQDLEAQSQFIERKNQELEAAKNRSLNLREDVLMSTPDEMFDDTNVEKTDDVIIEEENNGDISDEAFMEDIKTYEENKKDE